MRSKSNFQFKIGLAPIISILIRFIIANIWINCVLTSFLLMFSTRNVEIPMVRQLRVEKLKNHDSHVGAVHDSSISAPGVNASNKFTLKCQALPVWNEDRIWRNAVLYPEVCTTSSILPSLDEQEYLQDQQALLIETILGHAVDFTPCGTYCLFHLDSAYSYRFGHPISGWVLRVQYNEFLTTGCWEPFNSQTDDEDCIDLYYNDWIGYVEHVEAKQGNLPIIERHGNKNKHFTKNSKKVLDEINKYSPKCSQDGDDALDSFNSTTADPFCDFRNYDGSATRLTQLLHGFDANAVEYEKNLKPNEIVHLFDQHQLGIDDLSDALALANLTFTDLNASSCNTNHQPKNVLICIYHRHSISNTAILNSQIPIKGWQYRTLDRCFIPFENMEYSPTCGKSSTQFNAWSRYMLEHQKQIQTKKKFTKCDRLPLSLGRNVWDSNASKYGFLPPKPTTEPPSKFVKYSEKSICGPRILIIGARMCGTNTIAELLSYHPRVVLNRCTEGKPMCDLDHFVAGRESVWEDHGLSYNFVQDRHNYVAKYAQKLPVTNSYSRRFHNGTFSVAGGSLTIAMSPSYLNTEIFPNIASRIKQLLPNAKIVVSLCNPVERMYTDFYHTLHNNKDIFDPYFANVPIPTNFTEFVQYMKFSAKICRHNQIFCDTLRRDFLYTGRFHKSVRDWRNAFGDANVLVLNMDESNHDKMSKITDLMGEYLPENEYPWDMLSRGESSSANVSSEALKEDKKVFRWLSSFFHQSNVALAREIGAKWPLQWNKNQI